MIFHSNKSTHFKYKYYHFSCLYQLIIIHLHNSNQYNTIMNKITIFSLTLLFALILPLFANAQVTVKGIVTDESGVPLVGVSVRYKELPQVGVTTDIDGKFSIKEMKEGKTIGFFLHWHEKCRALIERSNTFYQN